MLPPLMRNPERTAGLPERLRAARAHYGHTQVDAAAAMGVAPITVSSWERERDRKTPKGLQLQSVLHYIESAETLSRTEP